MKFFFSITDELNCGRVAVDIDHDPERSPGVDSAEEDSLIVAIDIEHHISAGRKVEAEQNAQLHIPFRKSLTPETGTTRQIRTGVLGQ